MKTLAKIAARVTKIAAYTVVGAFLGFSAAAVLGASAGACGVCAIGCGVVAFVVA